jgi:F0F1-type ATP synthase assembly protein I
MTRESNGLPGLPLRGTSLWPWMLAILTVVGLLLAIHQVVHAAVLHG